MDAEEKKGTENAGDANQQETGKNTAVADGQLTGTPDAAGQDEKIAGLTTAAEVERKKRQEAEAREQTLKDQMALMNANQAQVQPQQPTQPLSTYEQAAQELGIDLEFISGPEQVQLQRRKEYLDAVKAQQQSAAVADQQFANSHSDFGTAVGQVGPLGQFAASAELQKILMEKPHLRASCTTAAGAYQVVIDERKVAELTQKAQAAEEQEQQKIVDAKTGPMSAAAVGGGAIDRTAGLITATSTAADVLKVKEQIERGDFDKE